MKQIFTISGDGDTAITQQQVLSIRLGEQHFGFSICDQAGNQLTKLSWYAARQASDYQEIAGQHPELRHRFPDVRIAYDYPGSILLPYGSPAQNSPRVLLETMYGINGDHAVIAENIDGWQLQNIYAVPADTKEWLTLHFPAAQVWHSHSIGIKQLRNAGSDGILLVDFHSDDFTVIAGKDNTLLLAQCFPYVTPADVIYYLVKIASAFALSQEAVHLFLSGLVEKESSLYRELAHYFLNIDFRKPAWHIPVRAGEVYPAHFFTSLNDLAICVS